MQESKTKEKILKKIRQALIHKTKNLYPNLDFDSGIYAPSDEALDILFAHQFTKVNGQFIFCENESEFIENLISLTKEKGWSKIFCREEKIKNFLNQCQVPFSSDDTEITNVTVGITLCENLVARTGSVIISSKQTSGRQLPIFPDTHIVLAYTSQLVYDIKDALQFIKTKYASIPSMISAITGPSRTADIEKTLVQGAHGPKEIFVFLIDDIISSQI